MNIVTIPNKNNQRSQHSQNTLVITICSMTKAFWPRHHFIWEATDRAAALQHKPRGQFYLSIMWKLTICFLTESKRKVH